MAKKEKVALKTALITGVAGQDGSYLSEFLLEKGYKVYGLVRRADAINAWRLDKAKKNPRFEMIFGDMTDITSLISIVKKTMPDEIYNLAAQSHVKASFDMPLVTADADGLGVLRLLEVVRLLGLEKKTRIYQASTSELFGRARETPQKETTPFYPRSPYGVAKLFAFWIMKNYREAYGMFACNGILFNHESERRGSLFVTRKVSIGLSRIKLGLDKGPLELGNLDAKRDWGYAPEYVEGMWRILQAEKPDDYVLATGETHSVREFVEEASCVLGWEISWKGNVGVDKKTGKALVTTSDLNKRPAEVDFLVGDASRARKELGWKPSVTFKKLVEIMVKSDLEKVKAGAVFEDEI